MDHGPLIRNEAQVDLAAIRRNVRTLCDHVGDVPLCAVVKANGYGHGAVAVAAAALESGATWLAVAHVSEAVVLRDAGIEAPILLLSEPRPSEIPDLVRHRIRPTVYSRAAVAAVDAVVASSGADALPVHVKVNTGMNRVGCEHGELVDLCRSVDATAGVELEGVWTHFAIADDPESDATDLQLDRFDQALAALDSVGMRPPIVHTSNSAGTIDHPRGRFDLVRCGIAIYGIDPDPAMADRLPLEPALSLVAEVGFVKQVAAGSTLSYGLRGSTPTATTVATLCIGYADGVPRRLWEAGEVLIRGRRRRILGVVTMDQMMVDCGSDRIEVGEQAVLIGSQGDERITATEWAELLDTIGYEIVCGISERVPRRHR